MACNRPLRANHSIKQLGDCAQMKGPQAQPSKPASSAHDTHHVLPRLGQGAFVHFWPRLHFLHTAVRAQGLFDMRLTLSATPCIALSGYALAPWAPHIFRPCLVKLGIRMGCSMFEYECPLVFQWPPSPPPSCFCMPLALQAILVYKPMIAFGPEAFSCHFIAFCEIRCKASCDTRREHFHRVQQQAP